MAGAGIGLLFQSAVAVGSAVSEAGHTGGSVAGVFLAAYIGIVYCYLPFMVLPLYSVMKKIPNDLLLELDRMEFFVQETAETIRAEVRPIVIITSNNEKELPDAFLRRCFFHYIEFPDRETMQAIVDVHFPDIAPRLASEALEVFFDLRSAPGLKKKPSTSELVDWLKLLMADELAQEALYHRDPAKALPPMAGALVKNEQDTHLLERLAFMMRRQKNSGR